MAVQKFSLASLAELDGGRIAIAVNKALERAAMDCRDRPALKSTRTVDIEISICPVPTDDPDADLIDSHVTVQIKEKIPPRVSKPYSMAVTRRSLVFNEVSPDSVRQATFDDPNGLRRVVDENKEEARAAAGGE